MTKPMFRLDSAPTPRTDFRIASIQHIPPYQCSQPTVRVWCDVITSLLRHVVQHRRQDPRGPTISVRPAFSHEAFVVFSSQSP
ncbi:hypothetical protein OPQ81_004552 [Rhizoctonia solani]|nr:hypothetical protein OPQ81_004552 [Rhizoctonia solani]